MGGPASSYATAGIALRVIGVLKPPHHDKVETPRGGFDYVNHNILLSKLEFYGITGRTTNLIKSDLNDRYQRVLIKNKYSKNCFSEWGKVKQGVPQDTILAPLFFILYINGLPGLINDISKPTTFVDNTNTIFTHSNLTDFKDQINIVIEKMSNWFQTNSLILNFNKTYYPIYGKF